MNKIKQILLIAVFFVSGCAIQKKESSISENRESHLIYPHPAQLMLDREKERRNRASDDLEEIPLDVYPQYTTKRLLDSYFAYIHNDDVRSNEKAKVDFADTYIDMASIYNSIPEIRPYLKYFPVTAKNTNMQIIYLDEHSQRRSSPSVGISQITKENPSVLEIIRFDTKKNSTRIPVVDIPELQMLNANPIPRRIKEQVTPFYIEDKMANTSFLGGPVQHEKLLFDELIKKHDLHFAALNAELGYRGPEKKVPSIAIIAHFWVQNKKFNKKEAEEFIKAIQQECFESARQRLQEEVDALPEGHKLKKTTIVPHEILLSISFWDEYMDRVPSPYMAFALQIGEHTILYEANAIQELRAINIPLNKEIKIADLIRWNF